MSLLGRSVLATQIIAVVMVGAFVVNAAPMKDKQSSKPALVFIVAGQSNAGGCGIYSPEQHEQLGRAKKRPINPGTTAKDIGLPTDGASYTHSYMWMPQKGFERFDPAVNSRPPKAGSMMHGMELPVVHELEKRYPDNDIYVIKYGPSGKNLYNDWNPERTDAHYATFLGYYKPAMSTLTKEYPEVRVIGLYWDQGESDKRKADEYYDNLKNFIVKVRKDTGLPQLNFFIRKHIYDFRNIKTIVAAQEKIVKQDKNCYILDIDLGDPKKNYETWSYSPGNIHLSSKGFMELTKQLFVDVLKDKKVDSFELYKAK